MTVTAESELTIYESLEERIGSADVVVGVIGLGYVGLPLASGLEAAGAQVLGFDVDPQKIAALADGKSYMEHLPDTLFTVLGDSERFEATAEMSRLGECDAIVVCVPTPLGPHQEPDLSFVEGSAQDIGACLRPGQLIVLESTTYPGTTREVFLPALVDGAPENKDLELGADYFVAYSPEREDPGRSGDSMSIPKLVGGLEPKSLELATALYRLSHDQVVAVPQAEVAEAAKLLENIFRSVNIALVNEMKVVLSEMGLDIWEVIEAASTKPFGYMPFYPGPGLGGHCIPIDPFYLSWKAKEVGRPVQFIELAGVVNTRMPNYVAERLTAALNDQGKPVKNSKILVLGLAYKADVADTRESPSFELIELLLERGADVSYSDPHIPHAYPVRRHDLALSSVKLSAEVVQGFDAVVVATAHSAFDYDMISQNSALVVDTRNAFAQFADVLGDRLVKA